MDETHLVRPTTRLVTYTLKRSFHKICSHLEHSIKHIAYNTKLRSWLAHCSFTQRDVDEGRVWYLHSGELVGSDGISDQVLFSVADASHPPNILSDQAFIIQVEASELDFDMSSPPSSQLTAIVSVAKIQFILSLMFNDQ